MATYEELFPDQPQPAFVPVEVGRITPRMQAIQTSARQAISLDGGSGDFDSAFGDLLSSPPMGASDQQGDTEWKDYGKAAVSGVGGLGEALAGAGEYLSNKAAGERQSPLRQTFGDLADTFGRGRRSSTEFAQSWFDSMTPEAKARMDREVLTLDPNRTIWKDGFLSSVGLKMAQSAPSTGVTLLPGALMMRAGLGAGSLVYLGASEGGLSMGSIAANIATEVEQAPEEELMQSQRYAELRGQMGQAEARQQLITEAQGDAPLIGGLVVGAISAAAGRYLEPVFTDKAGGLLARTGRGFISEGAQESGQSGAEQIAQNVAAQVFDADRGTFEGVPEAMGQGAVVGGAMGGATLAAVGPRPRTALPAPDAAPTAEPAPQAPGPAGPESFQQVFGDQLPPDGGWRGGDIESGNLPERDSTGQQLLAVGPVNVDVQAALNARADNKISDMFERQGQTPQQEQQSYLQNPWPMQQQGMDLPQASRDVVPGGPPVQQPLGMRERVRGGPPQVIEPTPATGIVNEDMSPPAGFEGAPQQPMNAPGRTRADMLRQRATLMQPQAPQFRDENQPDMFNPVEPGMADEPSAEPLGDLLAQIDALRDPDDPRTGVYLSAANIEQLRADGTFEQVRSAGVPLANFDGKGGTLIAKNRSAAEELLSYRDDGIPMQEVLGLATGAGSGKPANGDIAVQQRDEQGNVVRESLVADPDEADQLAAQFDTPGREGVILSAGQAIKRRAQLVAQGTRNVQAQQQAKVVRERVGATVEAVAPSAGTTDEQDLKASAVEYDNLKKQLAAAELAQSDAPTRADRLKARETANTIAKQMSALRATAKTQVSRVAPTKAKHFADARTSLETLTEEQIGELPDEQLDELFDEAAEVASGSRVRRKRDDDRPAGEGRNELYDPDSAGVERAAAREGAGNVVVVHGRTKEEIIAAHPSRSEKRKLVGRVKRLIRMRAHGGKSKTRPVTATATVRKSPDGTRTALRKSTLNPQRALDTDAPRELGKVEQRKHNERVRTTYNTLNKQVQAFSTKEQELEATLLQAAEKREADGNPPQAARDAIYGRAYLKALTQYGTMLDRLHGRSPAALKEAERFIKITEDLLDLPADKFLAKLAVLTQAETNEQAKAASRVDPVNLGDLKYPERRAQLALDQARKMRERTAWAKRLHDVWHKNAKYEQFVAPLMQKLIGYVTRDNAAAGIASERRGMGYVPTFSEMRNLRYALKDFQQNNKQDLYKPLKRWFEEIGFKFDENGELRLAKNAGQYEYVNEANLLAKTRDAAAFHNTPLNHNQKVAIQAAKRRRAAVEAERQRFNALTPAQQRRERLVMAGRIEQDLRKWMTPEQRKLAAALDRRETGHRLVLDELASYPSETRRAARKLADLLESQRYTSLDDALRIMAVSMPADHTFQPLIKKLADLKLDDVKLSWGIVPTGSAAIYNARDGGRYITFSRETLEGLRTKGVDPSPYLMHALLHEAVHAATAGELKHNDAARHLVKIIMTQARISAKEQGVSLDIAPGTQFYGFRDDSVDEFVAEAFTNDMFQELLASIKVGPQQTAWDHVINFLRKMLGMDDAPRVKNVLEAVLSTSNVLFTGRVELETTGAASVKHLTDDHLRGLAGNAVDKLMQSSRVTKSLREKATNIFEGNKEGGSRFLLSALTMEQMRDFYADSFGGGGGPMSEYMKAFFQRSADNSANMEQADKLSRRWTALTEQHGGEEALKLSQIMTESTLYGIHPNEPVQSEANKHVTSTQQKQRHADLAKRFRALPNDFKALYRDAEEFYDGSLRREVNLMTLNALRGTIEGNFNYTEADISKKKLNTVAGMEREFGDRMTDNERKIIARLASLPDSRIGPYFPLMRFGDYVVTAERVKSRKHFSDRKEAAAYAAEQRAEDPTLSVSSPIEDDAGFSVIVKEKEVRMAESPSEAEQARADMIGEYGSENVSQVQLKAQLYSRGATIDSNSGLKTILGKLDGNPAAQSAIKDFYLRSLSDGAFRKREIKRANRRGVDYDTQHRTFAAYSKSAAYYTSQLRFGWKMADSLIAMQKYVEETARGEHASGLSPVRMGEVVREINTRDKLTHDHVEVSKLVRGGSELSQFMMLTSPSYWMINATQPYMVTLPWLAARSSVGDATAALLNAQKLIMSPIVNQMGESGGGLKALWSKAGAERAFTVLEQVEEHIKERGGARADEYIAMLNKLKRDSIIDLSFVAELRDISQGQSDTLKQRVLDASRIMAHLSEVNNRIMTALASYDLYRNKGASVFEAEEFAKQAVSLTQFNYSSGNAPRLFQARGPLGQMGPLVFQFMKYPQHMYALLIDNMRKAVASGGIERQVAIKTLAGLFATHIAAGGLVGAMLQPIKWAIGLTLAAFGDDDEPYSVKNALSGETFDRLVREGTTDLFGSDMGEIAASGLPRAAGMDLSNRMSLGSLYFIDLKTDTAESTLGSLVGSFGGPLVNLGMGWVKGAQYISEGQVSKGVEAFMPKFAKDALKMVRYSSEGLTDATGKEIVGADKMSAWELFLQAQGFQPSSVSEAYTRRAVIKDAKSHDDDRRATLIRRFQNAAVDDRADIIDEIAAFSKKNPAAAITRSQLLKSVQGFAKRSARTSQFGVDLQGDDRLYEEEGEIYEEDE